MGIYSTILASTLGFIIIINELIRTKKTKPFDIMSGVNLMFFLSFVVTPFSIYLFNMEFSAWTKLVNVEKYFSIIAIFYVLLGYISILLGTKLSEKWSFVKKMPSEFNRDDKKLERFAHFIGCIGFFFLFIFIISVGGIEEFFNTNTLYRSGEVDPVPLAFTRNLAMFIPISCLIFYGLQKTSNKLINRYQLFFIIYFIAAILLYFNRASRMGLLVFIVGFVLLNVLYYRKSILRYMPIMLVVFLFLVFYGKRIFNYFVVDDFSLKTHGLEVSQIIGEFSFPFFTLTNAIENSFFNDMPRLFIDFVLGLVNLLPASIVPFSVPMNATQLNTESFLNMSGIPMDLISLGFYSFGISGIILISLIFGMLIGGIEKILSDKKNLVVMVFYIQFIFFFSLIVPYAGPTNLFKSDFSLFVSFIVFIFVFNNSSNKTLNNSSKGLKC
ncbi:hypothetical protein GCM10007063_16960 [Lentibacillus kapialis]|uniref:Oligosaccharide repeat unit polymerase n=1 Tax=Lentibacillus kapialis TaxID=340214 RepID=A0A917UXK2_9BACI|nr:O-antigen polymerase [Lentibacillus kapialis]GGJ95041.1 hypothetical protein GCM10007063_16960 [Lentibacillus kapialis]